MRILAALLFALLPAVAASAALPVETARVLATHPHDTAAFTEGLLVRDGILYESTGFEGQSFISRKELATGRTLARVAIPSDLFGEGIVDWQDKLYSFVWRGGRGFVWGVTDLKPSDRFKVTLAGDYTQSADSTPSGVFVTTNNIAYQTGAVTAHAPILYRVAQDAVANAIRHARARTIRIVLRAAAGGIALSVVDDGVGFDPATLVRRPDALGVAGMRDRAELAGGRLAVTSAPGRGTTVEAWVPEIGRAHG
mgnify:CR=1 FL=1